VYANNVRGLHLWKELFSMVELRVNMRCKRPEYASMCARLREHDGVHNRLLTEDDIRLLQSRSVKHSAELRRQVESGEWNDAIHIFPRLHMAEDHNVRMFQRCSDGGHVVCRAQDSLATDQRGRGGLAMVQFDTADLHAAQLLRKKAKDTGGIPTELPLARGAVVMVTRNLDPDSRIVNGQRGEVLGWEVNADKVRRVFVRFFDPGVGRDRMRMSCPFGPDAVHIEPTVTTYDGRAGKKVTREGFAMVHAWGASIHKAQGATMDRLVASIDDVFECGQVYVALSRVRSEEGIVILSDIDPSKIRANLDAVRELQRLRGERPHVAPVAPRPAPVPQDELLQAALRTLQRGDENGDSDSS